jgi:hypothetical protein
VGETEQALADQDLGLLEGVPHPLSRNLQRRLGLGRRHRLRRVCGLRGTQQCGSKHYAGEETLHLPPINPPLGELGVAA